MANSFLNALQSSASEIGSKVPRLDYSNITQAMPGASAPRFKTSTPRFSSPDSLKDIGTVTVKPGGSTRYEDVHPGIDIANVIGTQLPAFTSGVVTEVKTGQRQGSPAYGNYVIITDKDGNRHRYSHLNNSLVKIGDQVEQGQIIGGMGNTGQTYSTSGGTGSHLDYRIQDAYRKYVDPMVFINALTGSQT